MDKGHYTTMLEALAQVPEPRHKRGVRHSWTLILGLIVAAMVSGHKHGRAIAQAALRNCILGLLRHKGWQSLADALRHYGAYPDPALNLIGALPTRL